MQFVGMRTQKWYDEKSYVKTGVNDLIDYQRILFKGRDFMLNLLWEIASVSVISWKGYMT